MEFKKSEKGFIQKYKNYHFFDSLRKDYPEFDKWYDKSVEDEKKKGYYWIKDDKIEAFLGMKLESEEINLHNTKLVKKERLKITTIKSNEHIKNFSEFVIYFAIDKCIREQIDEIYFSIINNDENKNKLIEITKEYGFKEIGYTQKDGKKELYLMKNINSNKFSTDEKWKTQYPKINLKNKNLILPIDSIWHDEYLQDAKLKNIKTEFNPYKFGISKAYVHNIRDIIHLNYGDNLMIYRKSDIGPKKHKSVITGIGIVQKHYTKCQDYHNVKEFKNILKNKQAFLNDDQTIEKWFKEKKYITFFTWNISFGEGNNINLNYLQNNDIWGEGIYPSKIEVEIKHIKEWIIRSKGELCAKYYYQ